MLTGDGLQGAFDPSQALYFRNDNLTKPDISMQTAAPYPYKTLQIFSRANRQPDKT